MSFDFKRTDNGALVQTDIAKYSETVRKRKEQKRIEEIEKRIYNIEVSMLEILNRLNQISEKVVGLSNQ